MSTEKPVPVWRQPWYQGLFLAIGPRRVMTLEEQGALVIPLQLEWSLGMLPKDKRFLARALGVSRQTFKRLWLRVGQHFVERDGRLINERLESERAKNGGAS